STRRAIPRTTAIVSRPRPALNAREVGSAGWRSWLAHQWAPGSVTGGRAAFPSGRQSRPYEPVSRAEVELDDREVVGELVRPAQLADVVDQAVHVGHPGGRRPAHEADELAPRPHGAVLPVDLEGAVTEQEKLGEGTDLEGRGAVIEVGKGADHR